MPSPILLYSTNTWLASRISTFYYNDEHYAWCSPYFDAASVPPHTYVLPPTSSPSEIYRNLFREVGSGDLHSLKIESNKTGIRNGAAFKKSIGVIDARQQADILAIVDAAQINDFRPLLYVIPYGPISAMVKPVPWAGRAHAFSPECLIESLPRGYFDIIEFEL
jgi:hypothetical protein